MTDSGADPQHAAPTPTTPPPASPGDRVGDWGAAALVFGANAAVLVVELVALRLLAPYLGLTLETNTLVIGIALTAIALGSWVGGRWADRVDPRRALAPLLAVSGLAVAATPFLVRVAGAVAHGAFLLVASAATIVVPGALLSAVTPMVTKLRLTSLSQTGTIVGRLSGVGTAGAIAGTILTGFVLITRVPVSGIMLGLGGLLLAAALAVGLGFGLARARLARASAAGAAVALVLAGATALTPSGCDAETTYHCAAVVSDPQRAGGRTLVLDGLRHSYVDVQDPRHVQFAYVRAMVAGIDAHRPGAAPLTVHYVGGGGLTLPRYLAATRPGSTGSVSEIDAGVVRIDRERLALPADLALDVRIEDGRVGLRSLPPTSADIVVGDAFGGVSVPWHLTTREALTQVERGLRADGLYTVNLIDYAPLAFARAEVATLRSVFGHVALAATPDTTAAAPDERRRGGGNLVVIASRAPLDVAAWEAELRRRDLDWRVISGAALAAWVGDAPVLTDDDAPVDQLLTPYPPAAPA